LLVLPHDLISFVLPLYLFLSIFPSGDLGDLYRFDTNTDIWTALSASDPPSIPGRFYMGFAATSSGTLYVFGGQFDVFGTHGQLRVMMRNLARRQSDCPGDLAMARWRPRMMESCFLNVLLLRILIKKGEQDMAITHGAVKLKSQAVCTCAITNCKYVPMRLSQHWIMQHIRLTHCLLRAYQIN
jgi:hypothetical protein